MKSGFLLERLLSTGTEADDLASPRGAEEALLPLATSGDVAGATSSPGPL